jgi:hypothetical protein
MCGSTFPPLRPLAKGHKDQARRATILRSGLFLLLTTGCAQRRLRSRCRRHRITPRNINGHSSIGHRANVCARPDTVAALSVRGSGSVSGATSVNPCIARTSSDKYQFRNQNQLSHSGRKRIGNECRSAHTHAHAPSTRVSWTQSSLPSPNQDRPREETRKSPARYPNSLYRIKVRRYLAQNETRILMVHCTGIPF